ncbi:uncharacterized protein LOC117101221 [Anneissia japonica]|uniref:uncharacterized protein LOC117101221 n=1 Tax=Anneissia japonica TaxID=1529436 RepID=UPI0014256EAC|nr:uncharacterized protein LOC117101221 [Anneissia japonica]XP_033097026.1 uncharacterized protein LOC117101221 [Anneissia japonica]XP_033097027.1 uncharacterized protein LOC117101221 [Anneissia japonica]
MENTIQFQEVVQKAFGKYYDHSNYPTTVASELLQVLSTKYENNLTLFKEEFVKPTQKLLETLKQNKMHLYTKQDQKVKIIVHLALSVEVQTGEFFFSVGHTNPGTLTVKFCKYVTQLDDGINLAEPKYTTVKMTVDKNSLNECLTLDYFKDLRENGEKMGTERTSVMFRLCWVKVLDQNVVGGFLKIYDAKKILSHRKQKKLVKSISSPVPIQQANIQPFHKPQQVSDDASLISHHPMEEGLHPPSKITRQQAYDSSDPVVSKEPEMEWQEDPTGMGGGGYVPSTSDNLNLPTDLQIASNKPVASKPPVNEWKSQNIDSRSGDSFGCSSLSPTASGNIHVSTVFVSSGPEALCLIDSLKISAHNDNNEYGRQGIESGGTGLAPSNTSAKDVSNGYVREFEGIGPTGTPGVHLMAEGNNPQPANNVSSDKPASSKPSGASLSDGGTKEKPANDVDDGYVERIKGMDPSSTSSSMAQAAEKNGGLAKEVNDGYVSEDKATDPK